MEENTLKKISNGSAICRPIPKSKCQNIDFFVKFSLKNPKCSLWPKMQNKHHFFCKQDFPKDFP